MEPEDTGYDLLLFWQAVVLELQIIAVLPKQLLHLQGVGLCPFVVPIPQQAGDLPRQAGGQGDQTLAVGAEQFHIDTGLDIKSL